jgi:cytochrome c oxidase assembly protein subunit 15
MSILRKSQKPIIIWLLSGCLLIYAMVVIGAITRLTHSGLSMVEWNLILGSLPPTTDEAWSVPYEKYKESPEFKLKNYDFSLEDFKSIYWWEYIHRFLGRTIGFIFILGFVIFLIQKRFKEGFLRKMFLLLLLGALQGVIGWYMVKSGLVKNPYVSHYRLATHLISAFTVFGFTLWFALDLIYPEKEKTYNASFHKLSLLTFVLLILQIIYGAFVAGLKAGYLFPTFPMMGNKFIADEVFALSPVLHNFFEGKAGVQFIHRYLAYAVTAMIIWLYFKFKKTESSPLQQRIVSLLLIGVLVQFILGILTLVLNMPIILAVLHQTGAFVLFSLFVFFFHRYRKV